jgi:plastocyanin
MVLIAHRTALVIAATCALALPSSLHIGPAAAAPGPAAVGALRGRVVVFKPAAGATGRPSIASLGDASIGLPEERRRAVVYLESAPQAAFEEGLGGLPRASMRQRKQTFVPHILAVRVGTAVDFPNDDPVYHNVFSLSKTKRFDLGRYAKGQSKSIVLDEPGIVRVFCDIHSHMSAFILVFSHRFFAMTDDQGRYQIDRVPPGGYTLVAWYEGVVRQTRPVTVPEDGGTVDVDFILR